MSRPTSPGARRLAAKARQITGLPRAPRARAAAATVAPEVIWSSISANGRSRGSSAKRPGANSAATFAARVESSCWRACGGAARQRRSRSARAVRRAARASSRAITPVGLKPLSRRRTGSSGSGTSTHPLGSHPHALAAAARLRASGISNCGCPPYFAACSIENSAGASASAHRTGAPSQSRRGSACWPGTRGIERKHAACTSGPATRSTARTPGSCRDSQRSQTGQRPGQSNSSRPSPT